MCRARSRLFDRSDIASRADGREHVHQRVGPSRTGALLELVLQLTQRNAAAVSLSTMTVCITPTTLSLRRTGAPHR